MKCPRCKSPLRDGAYFCGKCGYQIRKNKFAVPKILALAIVAFILIVCTVSILAVKRFSYNNNKASGNEADSADVAEKTAESEKTDYSEMDSEEYEDDRGQEETEEGIESAEEDMDSDEIPYTDNEYMDVSRCLNRDAYYDIYSQDETFYLSYPKYLFNQASFNPEGQNYRFSYMDGGEEFCCLKFYKEYNPGNDPVDAAKDLRARFDKLGYVPNYYFPNEDMSKITSDQTSPYREPREDGRTRYIMSGWTDTSKSKVFYVMGTNDGNYDYIMEFCYPEKDVNNTLEDWDYINECVYRLCSFSGSDLDVRSYDTFLKEGYTEGHH